MDLNTIEWGEFSLGKIFNISRGKRLIEKDRIKGNIPYYSASILNNGLTDFIKNALFLEKDSIIVTTFCDSYYVKGNFTASDEISILKNEFLNEYSGKFISRIITSNKEKFAFGHKAFTERIKKQIILLPINEKGNPDYIFMEQYMLQIETEKRLKYYKYIQKRLEQVKDFKEVVALNEKEWVDFNLEYFFNIFTGGDLIIQNVKLGDFPVISHSKEKNGVAVYSSPIIGKKLYDSNKTISLADRGNFWATTQPIDFYIGTRVKALEFKSLTNKFILRFFSLMINKQESRFSYGNNATGKTNKIKILLPINEEGSPDYDYMENYIKKMEYEKLTKYLKIKTN